MKDQLGKWINIIEVPTKGITQRFQVINKESKKCIGEVKWYGPFRQYSYFPNMMTVYERQCLKDITQFIESLMNERTEQRKINP